MPFPAITSPRNEKIKATVKLRRRKHRGKQGRTLIDGARELSRALAAGVDITEIYFCPSLCNSSESRRLLEQLEELTMNIYEVTENVFEQLAFGERVEGLLAVAIPPDLGLDDLVLSENPLVAVVEGIEKPGNLGAVIRSADGAGVTAVILADQRTDIYNPNAIRASLGTVFTMPVCTAASKDVRCWLQKHELTIFAATVNGAESYSDVDFCCPAAIVLGAEATGLSTIWEDVDVRSVSLPMRGVADSLNISTAATVLFYEAQRQRYLAFASSRPAALRPA